MRFFSGPSIVYNIGGTRNKDSKLDVANPKEILSSFTLPQRNSRVSGLNVGANAKLRTKIIGLGLIYLSLSYDYFFQSLPPVTIELEKIGGPKGRITGVYSPQVHTLLFEIVYHVNRKKRGTVLRITIDSSSNKK